MAKDLEHSMISDADPLTVEHVRVLQAVKSARDVIHTGLMRYKERSKEPIDQLWRLYEAALTTRNLLNDILDIESPPLKSKK